MPAKSDDSRVAPATQPDAPVLDGAADEARPGGEAPRPRRADAQRNRVRVLDAAEALFARSGSGVPVEEIARQAGVGVGTVCRNFPTKQDLLDAVLVRMFEDLVATVRAALALDDPGAGFEAYVRELSELQVRHRALGQHMARQLEWPASAMALRSELRASVTTLLKRAQDAGAVRGDISPADLSVLFAGIAQITSMSDVTGDELRTRYVAILLDGLRPAAVSKALPARPLTYDQLDEITRRHAEG
jgi:AcrR family transcriptional regulator